MLLYDPILKILINIYINIGSQNILKERICKKKVDVLTNNKNIWGQNTLKEIDWECLAINILESDAFQCLVG